MFEAKDKYHHSLVVKVCPLSRPADGRHVMQTTLGQLRNEVNILTGPLEGCPGVPIVTTGSTATHFIVAIRPFGESLASVVQRNGVDTDKLLHWSRTLAKLLKGIHAQKVLHRDIKPHNIIVTPEGDLFFIDFGYSGLVEKAHTDRFYSMGTQGFIPLSCSFGVRRTARDDVVSLCLCLYSLHIGLDPYYTLVNTGKQPSFVDVCGLDPFAKLCVEVYDQTAPLTGLSTTLERSGVTNSEPSGRLSATFSSLASYLPVTVKSIFAKAKLFIGDPDVEDSSV